MQRLDLQGYLDELFQLLTKIKDSEDKFTVSELKKIQSQRSDEDQSFDFTEQYNNNCQIFTQNLQLIIQLLVHDVWQKKSQYSLNNSPMKNKSSHKLEASRNNLNLSSVSQINVLGVAQSVSDSIQQSTQPNTQRILSQSDLNSSQMINNNSSLLNNLTNSNINANNEISSLSTSQCLKKSAVMEKDRHTPSFNNKQQNYFQPSQDQIEEPVNKISKENNSTLNTQKSNIVISSNEKNQNLAPALPLSSIQQHQQQITQQQHQSGNNNTQSILQQSHNQSQNLKQSQTLVHSSSYSNLSNSKININSSAQHTRQYSGLKSSIDGNIRQSNTFGNSLNQSGQYLNTQVNQSQQQKTFSQQHPPLPHSASSVALQNTLNRGQYSQNQNTVSAHLSNSLLKDDRKYVNYTNETNRDSYKRNQNNTNSILKPHYFSTADYSKCNTQRSYSYNNSSSRDINQQMTSRNDLNSMSMTHVPNNESKNKENFKPLSTSRTAYLH